MRGRQLALLLSLAGLIMFGTASAAQTQNDRTTPIRVAAGEQQTYQGKNIRWWATRAVANRREVNAARREIRRLRIAMLHSASIEESVLIATTAYPQMNEATAWCIIRRESWDGTASSLLDLKPTRARNRTPMWDGEHATGLFQFLPSTFRSTPYGKYSIYSPYVQSMAAGWMFAHGRSREWTNGCT